jgi:hypothetical protein
MEFVIPLHIGDGQQVPPPLAAAAAVAWRCGLPVGLTRLRRADCRGWWTCMSPSPQPRPQPAPASPGACAPPYRCVPHSHGCAVHSLGS